MLEGRCNMQTIKTLTTVEMIQRWVESGHESIFIGKRDNWEVKVGTVFKNSDGSNPNLGYFNENNKEFIITDYVLGYTWEEIGLKKEKIEEEIKNIENEMKKLAERLEQVRKRGRDEN